MGVLPAEGRPVLSVLLVDRHSFDTCPDLLQLKHLRKLPPPETARVLESLGLVISRSFRIGVGDVDLWYPFRVRSAACLRSSFFAATQREL